MMDDNIGYLPKILNLLINFCIFLLYLNFYYFKIIKFFYCSKYPEKILLYIFYKNIIPDRKYFFPILL